MKEQNSIINEVIRIVNGALRLDVDKVRNYTAFLADKIEQGGDKALASRLRKAIAESDQQLRPTDVNFSRVPVDSESRFPLVERINLKSVNDHPIVLSQQQWYVINEFLSIAKSHAQIDAEGLASSLCLLLYGPPGTGKSRLARYIANDLGLDLYVARLDGLISSFLGSTSKNIRALFDFAAKTPCVLFLDEFDAIAKLRGDTQELGELKRVVNSFIQNLDSLSSHSIVIAATNHDSLLDSAVWRRFNYRLELIYPLEDSRRELWRQFLQPIEFASRDIEILADLSEGFSGSDIQEACLRLHRRRVISNKTPELNDLLPILQNIAIGEGQERRFLASMKDWSQSKIASELRNRDERLYSHAALAQLFGVSKATAFRWISKGVENG